MAGRDGYDVVNHSTIHNPDNQKLTWSVIMTCVVAASCGLIFGYDIGISGGVTMMEPFLQKFFPSVLKKMAGSGHNVYCVYDSQILTLFTSSLYLAGLFSSLVASRVTRAMGRKATMVFGGCTFLVGSAINCAAINVAMLIFGRIMLGFGVGFANQAAPVYISEMAPPRWRGTFNTGFQLFIGIGVLFANIVNYVAAQLGPWGWRFSLGLAAVPATIIILGALLVTDTPSSLIERGKLTEARQALLKVRGVNSDVETELNELIEASEAAKELNQESCKAIYERQHRPHVIMAVAIPIFQQLTGINTVAFYAPVLFQAIGFGSNGALIGAVIIGTVNLVSISLSMCMVDRFGRRALFIEGGIQMLICQVALAWLLAVSLGFSGEKQLSQKSAIIILLLMCVYAAGFGWSWGPLCFLVPSEIFPIKLRPIGQSITTGVHLTATFILAQTFLTMLCKFRFAIFLFFGGWIIGMTLFVVCFVPETKGVPLEFMHTVWEQHWYWSRFTHRRRT